MKRREQKKPRPIAATKRFVHLEDRLRQMTIQQQSDAYRMFVSPNVALIMRTIGRFKGIDKQDAFQLISIKLIGASRDFDRTKRVEPLVASAAINICRDLSRNLSRTRRHKVQLMEQLVADGVIGRIDRRTGNRQRTPEEILSENEFAEMHLKHIENALASLSEGDRDVFVLYSRLKGANYNKYAKIAGILGIKIGTVKSRLYRARNIIAAKLDLQRPRARRK